MDFKKNIYWIVLAAIVLLALIAYPVFVTDVEAAASKKKDDCDAKVRNVHKLALDADKPDAIKTEAHVKKANDYRQKVEGQIKDLAAAIKAWKIDTTFSDQPPVPVIPFDGWLSAHRDDLYKKLNDAKIGFPTAEFDKLTFKDNHTMEQASSEAATRPYRITHMAILEEVVGTLLKKSAKQDVVDITKAAADPWWTESTKQLDAGVLRIDTLVISDPAEALKLAQERQNNALQRAARTADQASATAPAFSTLPYKFTTVEIDFVAPFVAVPALVKDLENTERYHAVITKVDVLRAVSPFPRAEDVAKPGSENALVNSYYREGPVKVSVSFDIYEYDEKKAAEFARELNPAPAPAAAPVKKP